MDDNRLVSAKKEFCCYFDCSHDIRHFSQFKPYRETAVVMQPLSGDLYQMDCIMNSC